MRIDGETIYIRAFTKAERKEFKPLANEEESYGYVMGCGLVNQDGSCLFPRDEGEDAKAFAQRVEDAADLPDDTRAQICTAIVKLSEGPTIDQLKALKKN
jgi:hypothetical protein|tara:strand:- start:317 stop:616 length:300 start_codon:yes stop_codon:yes gene_type:complete